MKIFNLVLAVMFVAFAFVQINDPDPVVWISIYGILAVTCIMAAFGRYYYYVLIGLLVLYAGYSLIYFSGVLEWLRSDDKTMLFSNLAKMQFPYIEEAREYLGLIICILVLIMHLYRARLKLRRV